jgi:hypothetical protein
LYQETIPTFKCTVNEILFYFSVNVPEGFALLDLSYETYSVEEQFEKFVFDIGSLLVAAGGNLGLFLGFSCLSIVFSVLEYTPVYWSNIDKSFF